MSRESRRDYPPHTELTAQEEDFEVTLPYDVGPVLLLRVHKAPPALPRPLGPLAPDAWFCRWFQLEPPRGVPLRFPCYQWLEGAGDLLLRDGAGEEAGGATGGTGVGGRARGSLRPPGRAERGGGGGQQPSWGEKWGKGTW